MHARLLLLTLPALLAGCDLLGIETASQIEAKKEAEGRAIGSACRHAVRSIEDCYVQNPKANKAAVFSGWREMDEYMRENKVVGMPYGDKKLPMITEGSDEVAPATAAAGAAGVAVTAARAGVNAPGMAPTAVGARPPIALPGTLPPRVVNGAGSTAGAGTPARPAAATTPNAPGTPSRPASPAPAAAPARNG